MRRIGPEEVIWILISLTVTYGVPIFGIIEARKRRRLNKGSTISIVGALLYVLLTFPGFILAPWSPQRALPALLTGYWFYLANDANRRSGSSMHLF